mgnify:FL=1
MAFCIYFTPFFPAVAGCKCPWLRDVEPGERDYVIPPLVAWVFIFGLMLVSFHPGERDYVIPTMD